MISQEIQKIMNKPPKELSKEEFELLLENTKWTQVNRDSKEWADQILKVSNIIIDREKFTDDAYKEFAKICPNSFEERKSILEYICKGYLAEGKQRQAHDYMNKFVFVSMAQINFCTNNHCMTYFSFRPFSDYSIKDIKEETISLTHPREFNDPLDTILVYWLNKRIDNQETLSEIELKYSILLKKVSENIKLRCLIGSSFMNNGKEEKYKVEDLSFLMWSHYAKSHTGFCVEYQFNRELFEVSNEEKKILLIEPVTYPKTISVSDSPSFKTCLFEKSNFWEYEHEMRLALFDSTDAKSDNEKDYPTIPCKNMIKAVYLGVNCSDSDKLRMIKAIGDKDIPLYQMEIDVNNITRFRKTQIG